MISSTAIISDIHGNRWALEAVITDIQTRNISRIVNLGDSLYGPLDPAGTADLLISLDLPTIQGNEDRILLDKKADGKIHRSLDFTRSCLKTAHYTWLESIPEHRILNNSLYLCHGTPERDDEYLLLTVNEFGVTSRSEVSLRAMLSVVEPNIIACGHDHMPSICQVDRWLIINPGSVGCPAFTDQCPLPHSMETGLPCARYAILEGAEPIWHIDQITVDYDWHCASQAAVKNGRPDWAHWLATGRKYSTNLTYT
ncbi:metallophosphoesterase family protein [Gemmatimonadota bacterium]